MEAASRFWTCEERQKLFDEYFGPSTAICPICSHEVSILMSNLGRTVTLLMTCEGCNNRASVNRSLPVQGPLHLTATH